MESRRIVEKIADSVSSIQNGGAGRPKRKRCMTVSDTNGSFVCLTANETKRRSDLGSSGHQITVEAVGSNSAVSFMAFPATELKAKAHLKRRQDTADDGLHPREAEIRERAAICIQRAWRRKSRSKFLSPSSQWLDVLLHARLRVRHSQNSIPYQAEKTLKKTLARKGRCRCW